jgi:hyperosmotically inducible protein
MEHSVQNCSACWTRREVGDKATSGAAGGVSGGVSMETSVAKRRKTRMLFVAAAVLLGVSSFARSNDQNKTGGESPAARITEEVRHELVMLPFYSVFDNLAFQLNGNTIRLLGQVTRPSLQKDAENVVKRIEGVDKVVNEIEVLPVSPADDRIRHRVFRAIYGDSALSRYGWRAVPPIHIVVNRGHVSLEGVVDREADSSIANIRAKGVPGVFSVQNNLRIANQEE